MTFKKTAALFIFCPFALLSLGCQPGASHKAFENEFISGEGLFLTRASENLTYTKIYELATPALLQTATLKNSQPLLEPKNIALIAQEQKAFLQTVKELTPDAQLVYRYRLVLNALAISGTQAEHDKLAQSPQIQSVEISQKLDLVKDVSDARYIPVNESNPIKLIGGDYARAQGLTGKGLRIGVLDTGIDYTHKMLGGPGTEESYLEVHPESQTPYFPNSKIIGGIDLVGDITTISPQARDAFIPYPDSNPLDENGHGTHIAGTIAGLGDQEHTYSGVAPEAGLFAIKGVTRDGQTYDYIIIKALEYAADPNEDLNLSDRLHVLNVSLGTNFGAPYTLMHKALNNLTRGGTFVVASAGNKGASPYIIDSPAINTNVISVAASHFAEVMQPTIEFSGDQENFYLYYREIGSMINGSFVDNAQGEVFYWNWKEKPQDLHLSKDRVLLLQADRIKDEERINAAFKAGALGILLISPDNQVSGYQMQNYYPLPGAVLSQGEGQELLKRMSQKNLSANFVSPKQGKQLVKTIADFSSRGPRSTDGHIKPDITAPGVNILSAIVASGDAADYNNGTSMAAPHITGALGILMQKHPGQNLNFYKSLLMGQADIIFQENGQAFPVTAQGAGQVNIEKSLKAQAISIPSALSLGILNITKDKKLTYYINLQNISDQPLTLHSRFSGSPALEVSSGKVVIPAKSFKLLKLDIQIHSSLLEHSSQDLEGRVFIVNDKGQQILQLPLLAVVKKGFHLEIKRTGNVYSFSNQNSNPIEVLPFAKIGESAKKINHRGRLVQDAGCDLKQVGYRLTQEGGKKILGLAFETYDLQTTWHRCETSIQFDLNGDGITDAEATNHVHLIPGIWSERLTSLLFDGMRVRQIQADYDAKEKENLYVEYDYQAALIGTRPFTSFNLDRFGILEIDITDLQITENSQFKISTSHQSLGAISRDDYLHDQNKWFIPKWNLQDVTFKSPVLTLEANSRMDLELDPSKEYFFMKRLKEAERVIPDPLQRPPRPKRGQL